MNAIYENVTMRQKPEHDNKIVLEYIIKLLQESIQSSDDYLHTLDPHLDIATINRCEYLRPILLANILKFP